MNCPECNTKDFYKGLMGANCINPNCIYFKGTKEKLVAPKKDFDFEDYLTSSCSENWCLFIFEKPSGHWMKQLHLNIFKKGNLYKAYAHDEVLMNANKKEVEHKINELYMTNKELWFFSDPTGPYNPLLCKKIKIE